MKKSVLIFSTILLFTLNSCNFFDGTPLWLDNPTDKSITIKIDDQSYEIAPGELKHIDGKKGKHKFTATDGKVVDIEITEPSLINCTNETYVLQQVEYSISGTSNNLPETKKIEVKGQKYEGNFEVFTGVVIPHGNINYNVVTPLKDEVEFTGSDNYIIVNKMYRSSDFLESNDTKPFKL